MDDVTRNLLEQKASIPGKEFVRKALDLLEGDFRKMTLSLFTELAYANLHAKSLFSEIAALQRPSWGCWNGLLLGLLKVRRNILNTGTLSERDVINKCEGLSKISADLEEATAISDEGFIEILERMGFISVAKKSGKILKNREVFSIPIFLRNRMVHDNIQDEKWWQDAEYLLASILSWYGTSSFSGYVSGIHALDPWMLEEDGEFWCYNGIGSGNGESVVHYVSLNGKSKADTERASNVLLGFMKILGEERQQEENFNRLLGRLAPEELKGFIVGGYMVGEKAGEGGFADVYKGVQLSTGRKVAIKVLKSGLSESDRIRFLHEAEYLSMFDHSTIVKIFEYSEQPWRNSQLYDLSGEKWFQEFKKNHGNILTYIAMEWVEGSTLDALFQELLDNKRPFSENEIARWFCDAAEALELIHNANLIHRDISPKNIMITENGTVKLMDFGISRTQYENRTIMTSHGKLLGSEPYMSPEQLDYERAKGELGPRSDVYSLGATFYELFTRIRLYNHNNDAVSIATASELKRKGERPQNPNVIDSKLSWEIATILMGCLENEPGDRYQSARQLKEDLLRYLKYLPIEYKKPRLARRLKLMYKRNRTIIRLSAAFVLLVCIITAVYINSLISERLKVENANEELTDLNAKLQEQIDLTEEQRKIASGNETEARRQQKAAEENASLAKKNELQAVENMLEAQKQKALAVANEKLALMNEEKATSSMLLARKNEKIANEQRDAALKNQSRYLAGMSEQILATGDKTLAMRLAIAALPEDIQNPDKPFVPEAMSALTKAMYDNQPLRSILKHDAPVEDAVISSDGKRLITKSTSTYSSIKVWDLSSGKEADAFKGIRSYPSYSCISDDGNRIAIISDLDYYGKGEDSHSKVARIYDTANGKLVNSIGFSAIIDSCSISPKGSVLACKQSDGSLKLFDVKSGRVVVDGLKGEILFSSDERLALSYKAEELPNYDIELYHTNGKPGDMSAWKSIGKLQEPMVGADITFNGDSGRIAIVTIDSNSMDVKVYNVNNINNINNISKQCTVYSFYDIFPGRIITAIDLSRDGKILALGFMNGDARVYNADNGKEIKSMINITGQELHKSANDTSETNMIYDISISNDGTFFTTSSNNGTVARWDTKTGNNLCTYVHNGSVLKTVLTPDQKKLVSISSDKTAKVWEIIPDGSMSLKTQNLLYDENLNGFDGKKIILVPSGSASNGSIYKSYDIFSKSYGTAQNPGRSKLNDRVTGGSGKPEILKNEVIVKGNETGGRDARFSFEWEVLDASLNKDGSLMAVALERESKKDILIEVYNVTSRRKIYSWREAWDLLVDVNFTPDGKKIVVSRSELFQNWYITVCDLASFTTKTSKLNGGDPNYMIADDSSSVFAFESTDREALIKDIISGREVARLNNDFNWTKEHAYFSNEANAAVIDTVRQEGQGTAVGRFRYTCIDLKTGKMLFESDSGNSIKHISFSSDGRFAVINAEDEKSCTLWDIRNGVKTEISLDTEPALLSFSSGSSSLVIVENGETDANIRVVSLYSSDEAINHAKQLLKDTRLTDEEKIRYFAGTADGMDISDEEDTVPEPDSEFAQRLDELVGTYCGSYTIGDGKRKAILRVYKTGQDSMEGKLSVLNAKGEVGWECLMKVQRSTVDNRIYMYTYRSIREESSIKFPDLQGTFSGRVISGQTMMNYEVNGVFSVAKDDWAAVGKNGPDDISEGRAISEAGIDTPDVYSENGYHNCNIWKQGNRIYYCKPDSNGIYARSIDGGSAEEKLCDDDLYTLDLSGNWIYFTSTDGLFRIRTDGSNRQKLDGGYIRDIFVDGEWIYCTNVDDGYRGYKIKTDGSQKKVFINHVAWEQTVSGDWVYYRNGDDGFSLYRIKKDGTGHTKLNDINSCDLNVAGERIAFYSAYYDKPNVLYSMRKDGTDLRKIADDVTYCVDVKGDWVYYVNDVDGNTPYRVRLDGSGRMKLSDDKCDELDVCGDWVYYFTGYKLCRVKVDGSVREVLD